MQAHVIAAAASAAGRTAPDWVGPVVVLALLVVMLAPAAVYALRRVDDGC